MKDASQLSDLEQIKYVLKGYLKDYIFNCHFCDFSHNEVTQTIEINIRKKENESICMMLRMGLSKRNQEIYIYNIFLPIEDRGNGIGLGIIKVLFNVANVMNCALVLHSMVDSFYDAMLMRGAKPTSLPDCLMVTNETNLGY